MNPDRAHRRALADVNDDDDLKLGWRDLWALVQFVAWVILAVAYATGHLTISIH